MMKLITSGVFVAGMAAVPVALTPHPMPATAPEHRSDPRLETLRTFFRLADCPAEQYAAAFLEAADHNDLDWRLLPSLSFVESTGVGPPSTTIASAGVPDTPSYSPPKKVSTPSAIACPIRTYIRTRNWTRSCPPTIQMSSMDRS